MQLFPADRRPTHAGQGRWGLVSFVGRQSKFSITAAAIFLTLCVGVIDFVTGYEISVFLFYSLPILLTIWFADKKLAVLIALFCAIVWWWSDEIGGHPYFTNWHQAWETAVRLIFFLLVVVGGSALKARLELSEHSRRLEQEILRISEREQQRIGQDLHDGLCQYYAAVGCAAGALKQRLEACCPAKVQEAAEIADLIMQGVVQTRSLARGLFPVENDEGGLQSALQELAANSSRLLNINCVFAGDEGVPIYDNACATHLFRIAQEALNNAFKHGRATNVTIELESGKDNMITLSIADDGVGFQSSSPAETALQRGMGLSIMEYRARTIGGQLEIAPNPDGGTIVTCRFQQ